MKRIQTKVHVCTTVYKAVNIRVRQVNRCVSVSVYVYVCLCVCVFVCVSVYVCLCVCEHSAQQELRLSRQRLTLQSTR